MSILLGNLTLHEMETRSGVAFPEELKTMLGASHQDNATRIGPGEWHCFDIPFVLVCGDMDFAKAVHSHLAPMSSQFKEPMQIALP